MQFLIQHNLMNPQQLEKIRAAVMDYPHQFVGLIPFSREITSNEPIKGDDYIPYGSTTLTVVGKEEHNWKGLFFDQATFNYEAALANRNDMLNDGIMTMSEAADYLATLHPREIVFARPSDDLKQFSGGLVDAGSGVKWLRTMMECASSGSYQLAPNTKVVVNEPNHVIAEWRWFVVGGKVVSGSLYNTFYGPKKERVVDEELIAEAQEFADKWLPSPCCVMDLGLVENNMKVVEFNCINSSGFYDNDASAVFKALYEYCTTRS